MADRGGGGSTRLGTSEKAGAGRCCRIEPHPEGSDFSGGSPAVLRQRQGPTFAAGAQPCRVHRDMPQHGSHPPLKDQRELVLRGMLKGVGENIPHILSGSGQAEPCSRPGKCAVISAAEVTSPRRSRARSGVSLDGRASPLATRSDLMTMCTRAGSEPREACRDPARRSWRHPSTDRVHRKYPGS